MDVSTSGDVSASPVNRARPAASLSVKLGFAVFCAMASLAVVATAVFSSRLTQAYEDAGRSQLQAIVTTYDQGFRVTALEEPGKVEERIANLRRLNETIHKVSVSWHDIYGATLLVQDGHDHDPDGVKRDVTTSVVQRVAGSSNRAPIDLPVQSYTEVRAPGGAHYGKLTHLIKRGGTPRAMLELHYDLKALDEALAYDKRTVAGVALLAALTLTLVVNLFLGRAMLAPLQRMRAAAHRLGAGDRGTRLRWNRRDEIGLLAQDFDRMAAELDGAQQHLESLALTDPLTGLLNHRAFKERLEQELRRAEREKYALAVVALDVDNFKEINDRWGHAAGDEGLRVLAGAFRVHLRPSDVSGRVGGDEFCLAVVRSTAEEAEQVVDRLRDHIAKLEIGPAGQTLTISAGISEFPRHSLAREELIHLADGAMYWAKSRGRDRTCIYSADSTFALSAEELAAQAARDGLVNTVHALAKAVDAKDGYTSMHSMRVGRYAASIARRLGFDEAAIEVIRTAGVLHDVGKIGISDTILQKNEGLTEEEAATMRRHSELGRDIIAGAGMTDIADMVLDLHERWDGGGYPRGIAGEQIRLESRILHAADALEAMTSSRVYRSALSTEDAIEEIAASSGTQIDPLVADVLLDLLRSGDLCPEGNVEDADLAVVDGPSREG